jgi:very-short-patch-repair endonuclease
MEPHRDTSRLFARQHGLITRRQALDAGLSSRSIDHRVAAGFWERAHRGVYRLSGAPSTWQQRVLAACLAAGPPVVASHWTAGALWSLLPQGTVGPEGRLIELTIPERRRIDISGVILHRAVRLERADVRRCDGIPTTGLARTVVDLAAVLPPPEMNSVLDHVLGERRVTVSQIDRCLKGLGRPGRRGTGALSDLLLSRSTGRRSPESTFEWRLLRALSVNHLPAPIPQYVIRLPNRRTARVDFAYPEALLAIEADSYRYHSGLASWSKDRARNNHLIALGWRVLAVTADELRKDPTSVADQVARCLGFR